MQYMGEPTPATPASKYFAVTVAMIAGAYFFAVGAGLLPIPGGPSNLHGPLLLVLCVGLAFFLAGLAIIIQLLGHANDSGDLPAGPTHGGSGRDSASSRCRRAIRTSRRR